MKEYHKIETVYERDEKGTKKLIEGKFRNKTVEYLKDNIWQFTEKIDGTNIRIFWDGHAISFSGRTDKSKIPNHLMDYLIETFSNNEMEEMFEQLFGGKEVILFGEGYGPKIQSVGALYRKDCSFILFDIMVQDIILERENVNNIAKALGIESVPVVLEGTIKDAVDFVKKHPKSTIGDAPMEGLVGCPKVSVSDRLGNRIIVKIKVCDF